MSFSLWEGISTVAGALTIHERSELGDTPFVSANEMEIAIPVLPLLTGEGRLGTIRILSPSVSL